MTELMHQMRDPVHTLGGSVGSIPQSFVPSSNKGTDMTLQKALKGSGIHTTPATNLKLAEAIRNAQHDASPNLISSKMSASKSYTHGLSNSAGTVNVPTSNSVSASLSLLSDISPNHSHFFEVMYVGKIRVSHKRVPFTFIDDALPKFKAYDAQRRSLLAGMTKSSLDNVNGSNESIPSTSSNEIQIHVINETAKDCSEGGEDKSELDNIDKDNDKIDEESGETNSVNETTETQKKTKEIIERN